MHHHHQQHWLVEPNVIARNPRWVKHQIEGWYYCSCAEGRIYIANNHKSFPLAHSLCFFLIKTHCIFFHRVLPFTINNIIMMLAINLIPFAHNRLRKDYDYFLHNIYECCLNLRRKSKGIFLPCKCFWLIFASFCLMRMKIVLRVTFITIGIESEMKYRTWRWWLFILFPWFDAIILVSHEIFLIKWMLS